MFHSNPLKIQQRLHFCVQYGSFVVDICRRCKKVLPPQRRALFFKHVAVPLGRGTCCSLAKSSEGLNCALA